MFSSLAIAALLAIVALVPLPARVTAPAVIRLHGERQVYVSTPGVLVSTVAAGERVSTGDTLAVLANRPLELEVAELATRAGQQALQVTHLSLRQHRDASLGDQLPTAEKQSADLRAQLEHKRRELARLRLTAPVDGTVIAPPAREPERVEGQPSDYTGTPQQPQNLGCYLETGTLLCTLGDPQHIEALLIVAEQDLQGIRTGQNVRLALSQLPGQMLRGSAQEISRLQSDDLPPQVLAERMIPLETGLTGRMQPLYTYYQVVVTLEPQTTLPLVGATGWAKIEIDPQPLWQRFYRGIRGTFRTPW